MQNDHLGRWSAWKVLLSRVTGLSGLCWLSGMAYCSASGNQRGDEITWKLVLPDSLKKEVLRQLYNNPAAGHPGFKKTTERVRTKVYWCGLRKDVESWCVQCDVCASKKKPNKTPRAPMKTYNVGAPMERIAIDVMGPLPISDRGNKYILVVSD